MVKKYLGMSGEKLNYAISIIAGLDFMLFGYDQGVMGGILTMPNFLATFPEIDPNSVPLDAPNAAAERSNRSTYQGISVASYNLGCFLGAILTIFIGNPLGRRRTIFLGTATMVVGATLQASATTLEHFIIGRIITGIGNGCNTSTVPMWQSEVCSPHRRGKMVMIEGALITCGIMISYWVDFGMSYAAGSVAWRFPLALQILFCVIILLFVLGLPESPRWLVLKEREEDAKEVIASINNTDVNDDYVENEIVEIKETVLEMSKGTFKDLFARDDIRTGHRVILAYTNQMFQQISGINLITYYAATIYAKLGMPQKTALLLAALNGTEYFIASWPAVFLVERVGRRKLMLFGAVGQAATMAILAGVNSVKEKPYEIAGIVFLFVFNTFFAIGWLGMTWLYPAEITPLRTRAPANALSTSSNWIFNFLIVMITPVSFENIDWKTYLIFAVINGLIVPLVYFFYPETAYRSLEEMDSIFKKVKGWKGALDVVHVARTEPRRYGKNGELLIAVTEIEDKPSGEHHDLPREGNGSDHTMFTTVDEEANREKK